jgi:hypothetical protein
MKVKSWQDETCEFYKFRTEQFGELAYGFYRTDMEAYAEFLENYENIPDLPDHPDELRIDQWNLAAFYLLTPCEAAVRFHDYCWEQFELGGPLEW